jgi:hypothetical protein
MAHCTPVVATPNVGSRYLLEDGEAGAIADAELASTITDLLLDESRRRKMAGLGYRRATHFTWDQVAATMRLPTSRPLRTGATRVGCSGRQRARRHPELRGERSSGFSTAACSPAFQRGRR